MASINWVNKTKEFLLGAVCTAVVAATASFIWLVLANDKKLDILVYQVSLILKHVAPNAPQTPDAADTARDNGLATFKE
jgi:hypothetical protein